MEEPSTVDLSRAMELAAGLIREFEQGPDGGVALKLYMCPGGEMTIGWGHAVQDPDELERMSMGIDAEYAELLMFQDLEKAQATLDYLVDAPLTDFQEAALLSFIFNVGHAKFQTSTLLQRLNDGEIADVPAQLMRWVHADGEVLRGLIRRREAEVQLGAPW